MISLCFRRVPHTGLRIPGLIISLPKITPKWHLVNLIGEPRTLTANSVTSSNGNPLIAYHFIVNVVFMRACCGK